jgi:hypothetical protein
MQKAGVMAEEFELATETNAWSVRLVPDYFVGTCRALVDVSQDEVTSMVPALQVLPRELHDAVKTASAVSSQSWEFSDRMGEPTATKVPTISRQLLFVGHAAGIEAMTLGGEHTNATITNLLKRAHVNETSFFLPRVWNGLCGGGCFPLPTPSTKDELNNVSSLLTTLRSYCYEYCKETVDASIDFVDLKPHRRLSRILGLENFRDALALIIVRQACQLILVCSHLLHMHFVSSEQICAPSSNKHTNSRGILSALFRASSRSGTPSGLRTQRATVTWRAISATIMRLKAFGVVFISCFWMTMLTSSSPYRTQLAAIHMCMCTRLTVINTRAPKRFVFYESIEAKPGFGLQNGSANCLLKLEQDNICLTQPLASVPTYYHSLALHTNTAP